MYVYIFNTNYAEYNSGVRLEKQPEMYNENTWESQCPMKVGLYYIYLYRHENYQDCRRIH